MELQPIQSKIYEIRGQRVMLDFDLAELYQVETRTLKQAVRRNIERFPSDFMFEITESEYNYLKNSMTSQIVISNERGGRRYMPFAFTEQGVAMLSSVLRSETAIQVNIAIMRAFVAMRNYITTATTVTAELAEIRAKLALLERADSENAEAVSDLSEDMRKELDWGITFCDLPMSISLLASTADSRIIKSSGNLSILRRTACLSVRVSTW